MSESKQTEPGYREAADVEEKPFRVCAECKFLSTDRSTFFCRGKSFGRNPITGKGIHPELLYYTPDRYKKLSDIYEKEAADWPNKDGNCELWAPRPQKQTKKRKRRQTRAERFCDAWYAAYRADPIGGVMFHTALILITAMMIILVLH